SVSERILIVGFREATDFSWDDLQLPKDGPKLKSILHPQDGSELSESHYTIGAKAKIEAAGGKVETPTAMGLATEA
ncbi:MAG: hypothetical protein CVV53_08325, partial [Spirochaetae bacterium HGW-Spirochaetae-9]